MNTTLTPTPLKGEVAAIPSKSQAHRALICAFLAGESLDIVDCGGFSSKDITATADCLTALRNGEAQLRVGESGSTYRFLIPVAAALNSGAMFVLEGRLPQRPLIPCFEEMLKTREFVPGVFSVPGNISSQFISGLLFAAPLAPRDSEIRITGRLESAPYLDMTIDVLRRFGVVCRREGNNIHIPGNQRYSPPEGGRFVVEGDWSNAAFWLCADSLPGNSVTVSGLDSGSTQGDKAVTEMLKVLADCRAATLDFTDVPDLAPIMAVAAAVSPAQTVFTGIERLRLKESDRVESVVNMLTALGVTATATESRLTICGAGGRLPNGNLRKPLSREFRVKILSGKETRRSKALCLARRVDEVRRNFRRNSPEEGFRRLPNPANTVIDGCNDHRIVMAAAIAATVCENPVTIIGAEAVEKSYPGFWEEYARLGRGSTQTPCLRTFLKKGS